MSPTQAKNLEQRIDRLEKLVEIALRQDDGDWLNEPRIVKQLDLITTKEKSISEASAEI